MLILAYFGLFNPYLGLFNPYFGLFNPYLGLFHPYLGLSRASFGLFGYNKKIFAKIGSHSWQYNQCNCFRAK